MIVCEHCETGDCLELTGGDIDLLDGELRFVVLRFECSSHGFEGIYRNAGDVETAHKGIVLVDDPDALQIDVWIGQLSTAPHPTGGDE